MLAATASRDTANAMIAIFTGARSWSPACQGAGQPDRAGRNRLNSRQKTSPAERNRGWRGGLESANQVGLSP
jgi:hypothetical protein